MDGIDAGDVRLRRVTVDDVTDIVAACNDPLTQRFLSFLPHPYTLQDAEKFVSELSPSFWQEGGASWAIAETGTDRLIGTIGIHRRNPTTAEIGYWVTPAARGRGAATAAARAATGWAMENGYHRIELRTDPANGPSQRVAIAAGYIREGVRRTVPPERDMLMWSRLSTDPPGPTPRLLPDLPGGELSDGVVTLRPTGPDDAADLHRLQQLPEIVRTQVPPTAYRREQLDRHCAHAEADWLAGVKARLTIRDAVTDTFAGDIGLFYAEPVTGQALVGYGLAPEWRGRGFASRAVRLVTGFAFGHTGIVRLIAGTAPDNAASQRVLAAAGFQREGYQRSRLPGPGGSRIDDVLWALLVDDDNDGRPART
jgi:RimJ/RimL family protein N-acetyltransferase